MALIQLVLALILLGILYHRMIKREIPTPIGKGQAIVPIVLGVFSLPTSFLVLAVLVFLLNTLSVSSLDAPDIVRSFFVSFVMAGFPEEVAKLAFMLLSLLIFRSKVRNVYEYILIGAAVGFGFTLFEEFLYGDGGFAAFSRLFCVAAHMVFGMIMAKHLGVAEYNKRTGQGSVAKERVLALVIPILIHTAYDAFTGFNVMLLSEDETTMIIGLLLGLVALVGLFVFLIWALVRFKKDTEKYCSMELLPSQTPDAPVEPQGVEQQLNPGYPLGEEQLLSLEQPLSPEQPNLEQQLDQGK